MTALSGNQAITLLKSADHGPVNKLVRRDADRNLIKGMARNSGRFVGCTAPAPDPDSMAELLMQVGGEPDLVISLGRFKDAPQRFAVVPRAELARLLGADPADDAALLGFHQVDGEPLPIVARLKDNMEYGGWLLFDRDLADGLPADLGQLSREEWVEAMDLLLPGFAAAARVTVPSTTSRILVDGQPLPSISSHTFVQLASIERLDAIWHQILVKPSRPRTAASASAS